MDEMFTKLGMPEYAGHCFAITLKSIDDNGLTHENIMSRLPRPDYDHRIYRDKITDNYIVMRPPYATNAEHWERVR